MSIFVEDWRECLREQYKSVIRNDDRVALSSLTEVMCDTGFTEDELTQLRIEATMRAEDMPDDYVPDMTTVTVPAEKTTFEPHPLECQCPECIELNSIPHDEEGQPLTGDDLLEYAERQAAEADDDDAPQQLSMF